MEETMRLRITRLVAQSEARQKALEQRGELVNFQAIDELHFRVVEWPGGTALTACRQAARAFADALEAINNPVVRAEMAGTIYWYRRMAERPWP